MRFTSYRAISFISKEKMKENSCAKSSFLFNILFIHESLFNSAVRKRRKEDFMSHKKW